MEVSGGNLVACCRDGAKSVLPDSLWAAPPDGIGFLREACGSLPGWTREGSVDNVNGLCLE